ncbi:MAG: M81 family metallopeptidase [Planctomycetaceae bacterium]|nr:M81 family metallopeptidase [Planctomycetaceae bacterium]
MPNSSRILLAGLFHETHTFLEEVTHIEDFEIRRGEELLSVAGDGSPLAAVVEFGNKTGWEFLPTIDMRAMPSGTVANDVFETFWEAFVAGYQNEIEQGIDGIYLVLHGAMVTDAYPDVEGELLNRIRQLDGAKDIPICGVLDLHGNISPKMMQASQGFIAYQCNPHTDAHAASYKGAELLNEILTRGEFPTVLHQPAGLLWAPTAVGTDDVPMKTLEEMARRFEETEAGINTVNIFGGYAFADTPHTGVSISVITFGDPARARDLLDHLIMKAKADHVYAQKQDLDPENLVSHLQQHFKSAETPVILAEPSDNIGGGAPGDGTSLLRFFLKHKLEGFVVVINDPEVVAELQTETRGTEVKKSIGGKGSPLGEGPLEITAELRYLSDGQFELEDRNSHLASIAGVQIDMGPCAVLEHALGTILLTSRKTPPFDLGQLRSQGIIPERANVIAVKAAVAHRRAYNPIAAAQYTVDTPGPCGSNLKLFPYRLVPKAIVNGL